MVKWIKCKDKLPENPKSWLDEKTYLCVKDVKDDNGKHLGYSYKILSWADGWNCSVSPSGKILKESEIKHIIAWAEIPAYKE